MSEIKGQVELSNRLRRIATEYPKDCGRALYQEALIEQAESMARTPVLTGNLRSTHRTEQPDYSMGSISVQITVGDSATPYAVRIHEDLEMYHPHGQAKFLESTLMESAPYWTQRVAARLDIRKYGL